MWNFRRCVAQNNSNVKKITCISCRLKLKQLLFKLSQLSYNCVATYYDANKRSNSPQPTCFIMSSLCHYDYTERLHVYRLLSLAPFLSSFFRLLTVILTTFVRSQCCANITEHNSEREGERKKTQISVNQIYFNKLQKVVFMYLLFAQ